MNALDWIILLILAVAIIQGLMRGLVLALFSLLAWIGAFLGAKWGAVPLAPYLPVDSPALRYFAAFALLFLVLAALAMLAGHLAKRLIDAVGLGAADVVLGGVMGLLKGGVILVGLTLAAGLTHLPQTNLWRTSLFSGALERLALLSKPFLPPDLARYIQYR